MPIGMSRRRVPRFGAGCRNRLEADVGEEDRRCGSDDSGNAVLARALRRHDVPERRADLAPDAGPGGDGGTDAGTNGDQRSGFT